MFRDTPGFKQLVRTYTSNDSTVLYLGAGVNLPTNRVKKLYFDTYSWEGLLHAIYERNLTQYHRSFEELKSHYHDDWPGLAETLIGNMGVEKLVDEMDVILYHCMPRGDKDGRLSKRMLDQAPTLHAAICFTARIKSKWTFERNPRVQTVISPNYDFFFGAGWTRYQAFHESWNIQTPFSLEEPSAIQRVINYIHGYIPYRLNYRKELVLTRESYEHAYSKAGFARQVLEHAVRECHLIFIGTSFNDPPVVKILKNAKRDYDTRHFAIEKSPNSKRLEELDEMGIVAVPVEDYAEIGGVLEELYCSGLESDKWERFGLSNKEYWERLKVGPRGH